MGRYVFLRIIAGGNYFFFRTKRGRLFEGRDYFKYCSLEVAPKIFCFIFPLNQKIITPNKLNMGFLSVPNLVPWLIFRAWIVTDQFCWISLHFNLTGRGKKEERWRKGGGGVIIRARRLIEGRLLFEEIRYSLSNQRPLSSPLIYRDTRTTCFRCHFIIAST